MSYFYFIEPHFLSFLLFYNHIFPSVIEGWRFCYTMRLVLSNWYSEEQPDELFAHRDIEKMVLTCGTAMATSQA